MCRTLSCQNDLILHYDRYLFIWISMVSPFSSPNGFVSGLFNQLVFPCCLFPNVVDRFQFPYLWDNFSSKNKSVPSSPPPIPSSLLRLLTTKAYCKSGKFLSGEFAVCLLQIRNVEKLYTQKLKVRYWAASNFLKYYIFWQLVRWLDWFRDCW